MLLGALQFDEQGNVNVARNSAIDGGRDLARQKARRDPPPPPTPRSTLVQPYSYISCHSRSEKKRLSDRNGEFVIFPHLRVPGIIPGGYPEYPGVSRELGFKPRLWYRRGPPPLPSARPPAPRPTPQHERAWRGSSARACMVATPREGSAHGRCLPPTRDGRWE